MDEPPLPLIRLGDTGEVAAALPHLLGFRPTESVVLVGLRGPGGSRVGLTVRADLPRPADAAALARTLAARLVTDDPAAVLLAVVSEAPDRPWTPLLHGPVGPGPDADLPHRDLVHELVLALDAVDVPVREALLVRAGRWWDYDCPYPCCEPGAGTPLPGGASPLAAAAVAGGAVLAADRDALAARIAPPAGGAGAAAMADVCLWAGREHAARLRTAGRSVLAGECDAAVAGAVAACRPGPDTAGTRLPDTQVARVLWALTLTEVRDRALATALGEDAAAAEVLWTECTRRAPVPLDGVPATLLAISAWLRGDGATANVALDRALAADPGAVLPRLLADGLAACLPPAQLRALISDSLGSTR
ncbi:protein of unknown function [Geodermatophilus dictyosporus]|uniref:DUF4192 domain-containing protein n=1 Tax=Geodermatophilus dictyosporus TaxID=1523247 RepID=A0A1I5QZA3_9ACTN|nr:DUF4192 domain-containing protein [Geodermatophilus dictyosporus]SFP51575.1 protein of unknown function [Geodermatophilus dictyosporus]